MKSTGIVRKIDELGRIVLPMELKRTLKIKNGDPMEIYVDGESIVIKKFVDICTCAKCGAELGADKRLVTLDGITLCSDCVMRFVDEL